MNKSTYKILVVDDDSSFRLLMTRILSDEGYHVINAASAEAALKLIASAEPNLVISDLRMPGMDGLEFMKRTRESCEADFIMITAFAAVDSAVAAIKHGAADYLTKPLKNPDELRLAVEKIFERQGLVTENRFLKSAIAEGLPPADILFAGMEHLQQLVESVSSTDSTVLLLGETGTGKSLIARAIHRLSQKSGLYVDINCASIPENLLESEMFGHEKGAFTGAQNRKIGRFEAASGGTILLDEVSEMGPLLQAKFLRVLQEKTFERLGSTSTIKTDARIIAATNRDLKEEIAKGRFREDLYYRLNVFPISIPPLRDRMQGITCLAHYLAKTIALKLGRAYQPLSAESLNRIGTYVWPGNLRELSNAIERAIILSRGDTELDLMIHESEIKPPATAVPSDMKTVEREAIRSALRKTDGNRKDAAAILGISLRSLQYKIKEYALN